jgi:3-oxoacyl-[acyl-carrier-protein] synthase-1
MVAALGPDVLTNCAAARAGITRASSIVNYRGRSDVEGVPESIAGHQAALFTRGFEGDQRLVRLAQGALVDLLARTPHVEWASTPHRFYISMPDPRRIDTGNELIPEDDVREARQQEQLARVAEDHLVPTEPADVRGSAIVHQAALLARWPTDPAIRYVGSSGHTGGIEAIRVARAELASGATSVAVVLGLDSLLDESTLEWLRLCARLKCDGVPTGLQPGEAGVAIALTAAADPAAAAPQAVLLQTAADRESRTLISGASPVGEALAAVVTRSWTVTDADPWIISDQNGELYRAMEWGYALVRLRGQFPAFAEPTLWYPAISFGDTGAASALAAVCVAVRAWERRYAPSNSALILSTSEGDARAALALAAPDSRP